MSKMRHRKTMLNIQKTISLSFQGCMKELNATAKRAAIKKISPLYYVFGNNLTPLKDYLREYHETITPN